MNWTDKINITNEDNMTLMSRYPDNYFDLAIVDPPYGINVGKMDLGMNKHIKRATRKIKKWDSQTPNQIYFNELFRVSKNQIVWGGNYMTNCLPANRGWIFWDKQVANDCSFSDGELAWTSFDVVLKKVLIPYSGFIGMESIRIHPTQKPVKLYKWLLQNYAKAGDKILDTHLGSGSIAIACHQMDFELTGCELDAEYYNAALKRFKQQTAQLRLAV